MTAKLLTNDMVKKLINCVHQRRYLWDSEDNSHKKVRMLVKGWGEVSTEMRLPMRFVRKKWKNLKDMFNRQRRKYPDLSSPEEYRGRWVYFKRLSFLWKPWEPIETQYLHPMTDSSFDENEKAFIIKVDSDYLGNGDDSSDRQDDDFDNDSEPKTKRNKSDDDDDDYDIMFLKSLAPYMRSLSPVRKLQVRNQIQAIFLEKIRK